MAKGFQKIISLKALRQNKKKYLGKCRNTDGKK